MIELLALMLAAAQPSAQIQNVHTQRVGPGGDPDQIVCVRQTRIGTRLDSRRVCRTRAEWDELEGEMRNVVDRVQRFQGCVDPAVCPRGGPPGGSGGPGGN